MTTKTTTATAATAAPLRMGIGHALSSHLRFAPRVCFSPKEDGSETAEETAARVAAEAAKVIADKAAADKIEADKKAAVDAAVKEAEDKLKRALNDTEASLLKEVMAKKAKIEELTAAATAAAEKMKAYEGLDLEEVKKLKADALAAEQAKRDAEKAAAEKAGDHKRLQEMMAEEHKKELAAAVAADAASKSALDAALATINDLTVGSAFAGSKFVTDETVLTPDIARDTFGKYFEVEDGRTVGYDKPRGDKERTKLVNSSGHPLPFEDSLRRIVEARADKAKLMRSNLKKGTNANTNGLGGRETTVEADTNLGRSRIEMALAAGAFTKKG